MENSESRTVIVTGGNRGVGLGIITNLLKNSTRNYKIIMTARKVEDAEKTVQELEESTGKGSCITILQLDLLDDESISGFIEALKKDFTNGVDVLVNNAGIALRTKFY